MEKHLVPQGKRRCYACQRIFPLTSEFFFRNKAKAKGLGESCKKCHSKDCLERAKSEKHRGQYIYYQIKHRSKKHKIVFGVSLEEFVGWYNRQKKNCYYCEMPEDLITKRHWGILKKRNFCRLGIDKKNNNKGYVSGNIVLCCSVCNAVKGSILNDIEMKEIAEKYIKPRWEKC